MRYRMLGPFEVLDGDAPVHLGGGRQRAFLALLLLNANQVVSTDRIIDQLWGDEAPDTVANVIQVYVSRLRKALEPDRPKGAESSVLLTRRPGYMLKVEPSQIDAYRFEELAGRGRQAAAENSMGIAASLFGQALDLWTGEVLADLAFEDFARGDIDRLGEARLVCTEHLAEAQLALGRHEELVGELENLVGAHPLREQLWALLMTALYRSGRQAEALRAYRRAADILVDELGIDPSPLLQDLEEQILVQDPSLEAPTVEREPLAVISPQAPPPLIGRDRQMAAIDDAFDVLANGRSLLITVSGDRGMGVGRILSEVDRLARTNGYEVRRATAFPTTATQPGEIVDQLGGLDGTESRVLTVSGAADCDPTSLAGLRRAIVGGDPPTLVVLGLTPHDDRRSLGLHQMVRAVAQSNTVIPLTVGRVSVAQCQQVMAADLAEHLIELTGGYPFEIAQVLSSLRDEGVVEWNSTRIRSVKDIPDTIVPVLSQRVKDLPKQERKLVECSALAVIPMPLGVVRSLLGVEKDEALDLVEKLVGVGLLDDASDGVRASPVLASARLADRLGNTRRALLFGELAESFSGVAPDRTVGWFALYSNDDARAAALLGTAGLDEVARGNLGEAQNLLEGAIEAKRRLGEDSDERWGELHLAIAQCHRLAGWSDLAASALDIAVPLLSGGALVDALGWAAQVADDRQRVPESEWWVARGEHASITEGVPEKLGSLLSLRARGSTGLPSQKSPTDVPTRPTRCWQETLARASATCRRITVRGSPSTEARCGRRKRRLPGSSTNPQARVAWPICGHGVAALCSFSGRWMRHWTRWHRPRSSVERMVTADLCSCPTWVAPKERFPSRRSKLPERRSSNTPAS